MKSQVNALLHVLRGVCKDIQSVYPAMQGVDLDLERIALYCQTRGLSVFTLDLPNLDSILTDGLESGRLRLSGPLSRRVSAAVRVPRLFSGLWLRVFDRDASLKQEVDATAIFLLRQVTCLGKKIVVECSPDRVQATLENYHGIERDLRDPSYNWDSDTLYDGGYHGGYLDLRDCCSGAGAHSQFSVSQEIEEEEGSSQAGLRRLLGQVQQVADLLLSEWDDFNPISFSANLEEEALGTGFRHGPGAVSERLKNWEKSHFPNWPDKLEATFPYALCGKTAGSDLERPSIKEEPSRLLTVPKTAKRPRLIASEPTSHMWCQQLIKEFMDSQIKASIARHFIDFRKQDLSGALVLQASLDRKLATVDLSDASDRLSCWTVERIFRVNYPFLSALHAARTRYVRDDISRIPSFLKTKKFAAQGTAATFPVQSFVFLCIALGVCLDGEINKTEILKLRNKVRVYGDDIIIPRHGYTRLRLVMEYLQLSVNNAKSYVDGYFRESCGVDGYKGYDVTPVKPQTLIADGPASCQAVVDTTNNLFNKGLWYASDSCRTLLPPRVQRGLRIVGHNDAGNTGLTSFVGSDESHLRKRWNSSLHRFEVRAWSSWTRVQKRDREGYSALLDFFASKHSHESPRTVSEYGVSRKTRDGLLWVPSNLDSRVDHRESSGRSTHLSYRENDASSGLRKHPYG